MLFLRLRKEILQTIKSRQGFTLLEVMVVIVIMGFLAAMVVPIAGHLQNSQRFKLTGEKLQEIKTALVGAPQVYDREGKHLIGGYAGDTGRLPKLYTALSWDESRKSWVWSAAEDNSGTGQPLGLWVDKPVAEDEAPAGWQGPYLSYPRDIYPEDAAKLDPAALEFARRQVEGKLADAWGRTLLFWKEYAVPTDPTSAVLWIISEGGDRKSDWTPSGGGNVYLEDGPANRDNIVVRITPQEWYLANLENKEQQTREIFAEVLTALLGEAASEPKAAQIGGYLGELQDWPKLYSWEETGWEELTDYTTGYGQPRDLWEREENPAWQGPYLRAPWGKDAENALRDGWGQELRFSLDEEEEGEGDEVETHWSMTVLSSGSDRVFETSDDLSATVQDYQWQVKTEIGWEARNLVNKRTKTLEIFDEVAAALLGPPTVRDASGRLVVGGYLGDLGDWPALYQWDEEESKWVEASGELRTGQPLVLWQQPPVGAEPDPNPNPGPGFTWRGPYLTAPRGNGSEQVLRDGWGQELEFSLNLTNAAGPQVLTIRSLGANGKPDNESEPESADDLTYSISEARWRTANLTVGGILYKRTETELEPEEPEEGEATLEEVEVTITLFYAPGESVSTVVTLSAMGEWPFELTLPTGEKGSCGLRTMTVRVEGVVVSTRQIYIGPGGSQSPGPDRLVFPVE